LLATASLLLDAVVGAAPAVARVNSTIVVGIDVESDPGDVGGDDVELEGRATEGGIREVDPNCWTVGGPV
jgi:hypothetical protein